MQVSVIDDALERAAAAADAVTSALAGSAHPVLGVATGSSPLDVYAELARRVAAGHLSLAGTAVFALDEYVGLGADSPHSYAWFVERVIRHPLGLDAALVRVPDGLAADQPAACAAYELAIADAGGVDVQIAGIGENGHLAFNEPGSSLDSRTRVVELTASTRAANGRNFEDPADVPTHAVTQGLATVLQARRVVLVASGGAKAAAVRAALEGPVAADCPASVLQGHVDVMWLLDRAAAALLAA